MSRNIKTVKGLEKHLGETVSVVLSNGKRVDAKVNRDEDGYLVLYTKDLAANEDELWWSFDGENFGHSCAYDYQITHELISITSIQKKTVKIKQIKKESNKTILDLTLKELLEKLDEIIKCK